MALDPMVDLDAAVCEHEQATVSGLVVSGRGPLGPPYQVRHLAFGSSEYPELADLMYPQNAPGVVGVIMLSEGGKVNFWLRTGMTTTDMARMLRNLADAFERGNMERADTERDDRAT